MPRQDDNGPHDEGPLDIPFTAAQLRAFQEGVGAMIMPDGDGWAISYFAVRDVPQEPGSYFSDLEDALAAIAEMLPRVNTGEERSKMRDMEEILELRRRAGPPSPEG